jgi:hypothetical protein
MSGGFLKEIEQETGYPYSSFRNNKYRLFYNNIYKGKKGGYDNEGKWVTFRDVGPPDVKHAWRLKQFTTPYINLHEFGLQLSQMPVRIVTPFLSILVDLLVFAIYTLRFGWHLISLQGNEALNDVKKGLLFVSHLLYTTMSLPIDPLILITCMTTRLISSAFPFLAGVYKMCTIYIPDAMADLKEDFCIEAKNDINYFKFSFPDNFRTFFKMDGGCTNTTEEPLHLYFTEWKFEFYGRRKENDFFDGDNDSDIIESGVPRKVERVYLPSWKIKGLRCTPFHQCNECMKKRLDFVKTQLLEQQIRIDKRDKEYNYEPIEEVFDQELLAPVF